MTDEDEKNSSTEAGRRDLDYGHAFGTQRDRSSGNEADYVETYSDSWIDALPDVERDDAGLERAVRERLSKVDGVDVEVKEGVVTLRGSVKADVGNELERTIKDMAGVKEVHNELKTR